MSKDSELKKAVLDELSWEPSVDAAHIGVTANAGVVTLTGHVDNYTHQFAAEKAASRVKGVKAVAEEIEVKLPYDVTRSDEDIAAAAVGRLGWNSIIPDGAIQVKVEKGWVTLTGAVGWHFEREAVEQDIRALSGVVGVSNQVSIRPKASASNLKDDIEQALRRSAYHDVRHDSGERPRRQDQADGKRRDLERSKRRRNDRLVGAGRDFGGERHHRQLLTRIPAGLESRAGGRHVLHPRSGKPLDKPYFVRGVCVPPA